MLTGEGMEWVHSQKDENNDKCLKSEKKESVKHSLQRLHTEVNTKVYSVLTHYVCLVLSSDDYMTLMHELIF